jgi:hypothetical protein
MTLHVVEVEVGGRPYRAEVPAEEEDFVSHPEAHRAVIVGDGRAYFRYMRF